MEEKIIHIVEKMLEELNDEEQLYLYEEFKKMYARINMVKKYLKELEEVENNE